jgi:hypothetical protein
MEILLTELDLQLDGVPLCTSSQIGDDLKKMTVISNIACSRKCMQPF